MMFVAAAAMMFASCDKDDDNGSGSGSGSGSRELANTVWQGDQVGNYYTINHTVTFGATNQVTYEIIADGADQGTVMAGTYDYSGGNGTMYVKYVSRPDGMSEDNSEFYIRFAVSGNTMTLHQTSNDITLTKQ